MINKNFFLNLAAIIFSLGLISVASAVNPFDISYPISELGNCGSQEECKAFCDNPDNQIACVEWAQGTGFVTKEEVRRVKDMRKFNDEAAPIEDFGPGGCKTPQECDAFCRVLENLNACLDYSVSHGYMPKEEADKILAKANKGGPGGCKNEAECESFCRNPENMEACMNFAVENGELNKDDADFLITRAKKPGNRRGGPGKPGEGGPGEPKIDKEKAGKVLEEKGGGPGGCKTTEECGNFCSNPEHGEECMKFAVENGFMPPEEVEKAKKMMAMVGPGGCRGPQECDAYCGKEEHGEECINFTINNGLVPPEEIEGMKKEMEIVKKLKRGAMAGPGGCKGPQECQVYCSDQSHMEECISFASKSGMMNRNEASMRMQQVQDAQTRMQIFEQDKERFMQMGPPPGMEGFIPPPGFLPGQPPQNGMTPPPWMLPSSTNMMSPPEGNYRMPPPNMFQPQGMMPSSGTYPMMLPPEGMTQPGMMPSQEGQGSFVSPPEGWKPPPEGMQFPQGMMPTPEMMQQYQQYQGAMPPERMYQLPPEGSYPPPPSDMQDLPGLVLKPFLDIFKYFH